jgi:tripartite ATP-independent transporter DctP family solute receptor
VRGGVAIAVGLLLLGAVPAPAAARAEPEITLRIATVAPEGTPWAKSLEGFKKRVEAQSAGRVKVKIFLGGSLGDEVETAAECRRGALNIWAGSTGALAGSVPELGVLELPYLFRSEKEADYVLDEVLAEDLKKSLEKRGFVVIGWSENGYRGFGTKFGAIRSAADLKGHKMRSQPGIVHLETYRALGALPQPIPVTEVLSALQTGVVDGFDNTALFAFAASWHLAISSFTVTNHVYQPAVILASKKQWDKWPADLRAIILGDPKDIARDGRQGVRDLQPLLLENFEKANIKVHRLTPAERDGLAKATLPAHDKFLKAVPAARPLYDKIRKALAKRR